MINFGDITGSHADRVNAKIVMVPVPYDATSTWIKGADRGPEAIMQASANMELYDIETDSEVFRQGIFTDHPVDAGEDPEAMVKAVQDRVLGWLERKKFVVTIGGEHSVSLGAIRAHHQKYPGMNVLQLDAHADLRQEYLGSPYNHACVMARTRELCQVTQVGIRSMDVSEKQETDPGRIFYQEKIIGDPQWMDRVLDTLDHQVYLTLDLDVLDPSIMPSTGTPEPGGMDWYSLLGLIRRVAEEKELVGFDVVELCPVTSNRAPDFLAAKLIYKLLSYNYYHAKKGTAGRESPAH
ncbi:MAG TPA: agmatinase [Bacteroides sp.]|nr:agmatinase [Bacteroides sp.]